jgi:chromosome segregation ATPase
MTERPNSGASMAEERVRQLETERREMFAAQGQLETQRQELIVAQETHRSSIGNLEQQLRTTEAELTRQKTQYLQLK